MIRDLLLGVFFILAAVFMFVFVPGYAIDRYQCAGYESATGKSTKYAALECYVQDGGKWYSWSEYKYRLASKGEMK